MSKRILFLALVLSGFSLPAFAQLHWHLSALPSYNYKPVIKPYSGDNPLRAFPAPGWQGKFGAGYTFGKNELLLDWYIGQEMMFYELNMPAAAMPAGYGDYSFRWLDYTFLYNSVLLQYRRAVLQRKSSVVRIGLSAGMRRTPEMLGLHIVDEFFLIGLDSRPQFIPEFAVTVEREWWTKGGMHFAYGLESHLLTRPAIASGSYMANAGPQFYSVGTVSLGGGYTGFSFSYIFRNKQERRAAIPHETNDTAATKNRKRALRSFGKDWSLSYSQRLVFPKRWFDPHSGISSTVRPGFEFTIGKRFLLNRRAAVSAEFSYAILCYNTLITMDTIAFPSLGQNVNKLHNLLQQHQLQLAAGYHYMITEGKRARLVADGGAGLAFSMDTAFGYELRDVNGYLFFKEDLDYKKHRIAPIFRLGLHTELASNHGTWLIGADVTLQPFRRVTGRYVIMPHTSQSQRGEFAFSGSCAGIRVGYLFSRRKK